MVKDLTTHLQAVFVATGLDNKKNAVLELIENSHAKKETKKLRSYQASVLNSENKIDKFATNYVMSGEGMKVR